MNTNKTLVVILGPTAVGKTSLTIQLAKHFNSEIISADSRQFFKEMSIGTAKPNESNLQQVKHHFINSHSIQDNFNVGEYEEQAIELINNLFKTKDVLFLVGGSGLYIDAICNGFDSLPKADEKTRKELQAKLANEGIEALQNLLKELDEEYYHQVDLSNPHRVMRACEVCLSSGKKYSELRKGEKKQRPFSIVKIGININREALYERINKRVDEMMQQDLEEEVKQLIPFKNLNALQTVGYKELFDYFDNKINLQEAIEKIKQNTRNFAKRQLTWLRRDTEINWFEPNQEKEILTVIEKSVKQSHN